ITYNQFYFVHSPTNVAELTEYEFVRIDGSGWGFHAGADGSLFFTRIVGVGGFAQYSRGAIDLENTVATALGQQALVSVRAGGVGTAAFFIAIFPGNVAQYLNGVDAFGLDTDGKRFARLFFQPLLVAWALHSTGAWEWLRGQRAASPTASGEPR